MKQIFEILSNLLANISTKAAQHGLKHKWIPRRTYKRYRRVDTDNWPRARWAAGLAMLAATNHRLELFGVPVYADTDIGELLRRQAVLKEKSPTFLAKFAQRTVQAVSMYFNGWMTPGFWVAMRIANALGEVRVTYVANYYFDVFIKTKSPPAKSPKECEAVRARGKVREAVDRTVFQGEPVAKVAEALGTSADVILNIHTWGRAALHTLLGISTLTLEDFVDLDGIMVLSGKS